MTESLTLFDKLWNAHVVAQRDGAALLWIDRHWLNDASASTFDALAETGRSLRRPDLTFGTADHFVPSVPRDAPGAGSAVAGPLVRLRDNARRYGFDAMDLNDPRRGIVHLVGPEQGLTLPGLTVACADSHTATHGAFGCLGISIGRSDAAHVLATQTVWQVKPAQMRITLRGMLGSGIAPKDLILAIIARLGAGGAVGHVIEFTGSAVAAMGMAGRMTLCNMAVEAGAWSAVIAPDDTAFAWLRARARTPKGRAWDQAVHEWRTLVTDPDARFDAEVAFDATPVEPMVTWGARPDTALPVSGRVPDPATEPDRVLADRVATQLTAMGLEPNQPLVGIRLDRVFIGSCTNGGIEDLREAAAVLYSRTAVLPGLVVAGSVPVMRQAEREGLHQVFRASGLTWGEPGCSACIGLNGNALPDGERCAATSSRNGLGRQGPGSRTHLMSPAMVAAAALTGTITDVRQVAR
jgi:3-isopropylmalate/(R)-2-methylmalate dehydratase large subunit